MVVNNLCLKKEENRCIAWCKQMMVKEAKNRPTSLLLQI